jgi:hypothetical protein
MRGRGPVADLIAKRFARAAKRLNLGNARPPLQTDLFAPPVQPGGQMALDL